MVGIKGLTDGKASFPRIGILRKGGPKKPVFKKNGEPVLDQNGKQVMGYGDDLDHFRFDTKDAALAAAFEHAYCRDTDGQELKPQSINVFLPHHTLEENFYTGMRGYTAGALQVECDRESIHGLRNEQGRWRKCMTKKPACRFPECMGKDKKGNALSCKETGMLSVIIPELKRFAYVTAITHSTWDISRLTEQLKAIQMTFGRLNNIPMVLTKRLENISTPNGNGGRARRDKWLLSLEVSPIWSEKQLGAMHSASLAQAEVFQLAGSEARSLPPAPIQIETAPVQVEVMPPEQLIDFSYQKTELWYNIETYFQRAKTADALQKVYDRAISCVADGHLPEDAESKIATLFEQGTERIIERTRL